MKPTSSMGCPHKISKINELFLFIRKIRLKTILRTDKSVSIDTDYICFIKKEKIKKLVLVDN